MEQCLNQRPGWRPGLPLPTIADLEAAHRRLSGRVERTPVWRCAELDRALGCELWLKCEHLQRTGSFKLRGATHALLRLDERGLGGPVATHSSGNHGAALACAARDAGRRARIVMPRDAVPRKVAAVRDFGGEVVFCDPGQEPRELGLAQLVAEGDVPIPPYDHPDIITGQGTAALELLGETRGLHAVLAPLGGGGLLAGTALAARARNPGTRVIGVEPAGAADAHASLLLGRRVARWRPDTVADGLRALVGVLNFELIKRLASAILLVDDAAVVSGMRLMRDCTGVRLEPSAAVVIAAIRRHPEHFHGQRLGVILSGGNYEPRLFPWLEAGSEASNPEVGATRCPDRRSRATRELP